MKSAMTWFVTTTATSASAAMRFSAALALPSQRWRSMRSALPTKSPLAMAATYDPARPLLLSPEKKATARRKRGRNDGTTERRNDGTTDAGARRVEHAEPRLGPLGPLEEVAALEDGEQLAAAPGAEDVDPFEEIARVLPAAVRLGDLPEPLRPEGRLRVDVDDGVPPRRAGRRERQAALRLPRARAADELGDRPAPRAAAERAVERREPGRDVALPRLQERLRRLRHEAERRRRPEAPHARRAAPQDSNQLGVAALHEVHGAPHALVLQQPLLRRRRRLRRLWRVARLGRRKGAHCRRL